MGRLANVEGCDANKLDAQVAPNGHGLTAVQMDFANYLASLWFEPKGDPTEAAEGAAKHHRWEHSYLISRHASWQPWRAMMGTATLCHWWCDSLQEAAARYSWTSNPSTPSFSMLSSALCTAVAMGNDSAAEAACLGIFKWGGVARRATDRSRVWVHQEASARTLCQNLSLAARTLQSNNKGSLGLFDGKTLLMNSAMTKVYAALDPSNVVMYDGRVGAALGLLVRNFLAKQSTRQIPTGLKFRWGPAPSAPQDRRNPSNDDYSFASLYGGKKANQVWAELVMDASSILIAVTRLINQDSKQSVSLNELEKALFMIGANVRYPNDRRSCPICSVYL